MEITFETKKRKIVKAETLVENLANPFFLWASQNQVFGTFFKSFVTALDLFIIKSTCKALLQLIDGPFESSKKNKPSDEKTPWYKTKVPLMYVAVRQGFFNLVTNYFPEEWLNNLWLDDRYLAACCSVPIDGNNWNRQLELISRLFNKKYIYSEVCVWACECGNLPLLKHCVEYIGFPISWRCYKASFLRDDEATIEYLHSSIDSNANFKQDFYFCMCKWGHRKKLAHYVTSHKRLVAIQPKSVGKENR